MTHHSLLAEGDAAESPFFDLGRTSTVAPNTRYLVTLDRKPHATAIHAWA